MADNFQRALVKLREERASQADTNSRYPKAEPFQHGVQIGVWQGLDQAINYLEEIARADEEQDHKR